MNKNKEPIKFRIFDKKTGNVSYDAAITIQEGNISVKINNESIEDFDIEQFTNIKDKNGIEIYEGDMVKVKNRSGVVVKSFDSYRIRFASITEAFSYGWDDVEVIGNLCESSYILNCIKEPK